MRLMRRVVPVALLAGIALTGLVGLPSSASAVDSPGGGAGVAPDAVTGPAAAAYFDAVELTWTAPSAPDWQDVVVRMSAHSAVAPATVTDGYVVHTAAGKVTDALAIGLHPSNSYAFSVFARDIEGLVSAPATVVVRGTTLSLKASATSLTYGDDLRLNGRLLMPGDPNRSFSPVELWARRPDNREWAFVEEVWVDRDGTFATTITPGLSYGYFAVFNGTSSEAGMGSQSVGATVTVAKGVRLEADRL